MALADRRGAIRGRGCALAAIVALAVLGLLVLAGYLYDLHWKKKVEAKLAEFRAAGQPVTWEEVLATREQIPDDENSALILLDAFAHLKRIEGEYSAELVYAYRTPSGSGARHSEPVREMILEYLQANVDALTLIGQAAQFRRGAYPLDAGQDPHEADFCWLADLRAAVRLCAIEAVYRAEAGDCEGAVRSLVNGRRVVASLGDCPQLLERMMRIGTSGIWRCAVERVLEVCQLSPDQIRLLVDEAKQEQAQPSMRLALLSERLLGLRCASASARELIGLSDRTDEDVPLGLHFYVAVPGLQEKDVLSYLSFMDELLRSCSMTPRERWRRTQQLLEESWQASAFYGFCTMLLPTVCRAVGVDVERGANLHALAVGLAVEQWRLAHGRWPDSLAELVPEFLKAVPEDPFSDGAIRYGKTEDGVVVYSVGQDGQDNGGISEEEAEEHAGLYEEAWDECDLPFRLLNPELRGVGTMTFREEVMHSALDMADLEEVGFTKEKLLELGFTQEDLQELEGPR